MTKTTLIAALAAGLAASLSGAAPASAQNFLGMNLTAMNNNFNNQLNARMAQTQNRIVSQNMADPRVMAMYRQNPRGMSPQQFAYMYGATAGFTPQGQAYFAQNEARNRANEQVALNGYRAAQANLGAAIAQRNANFSANSYQRGMMLGGWNYAYRPNGGWVWYR